MKAPVTVLRYDGRSLGPGGVPCVSADLQGLLKSKLLITGGSGSGKSRALRSLCEQLAGTVQQIVFDFEGDLVTLTEVHDFLVAGDGGHVPAHPLQAAALAERVMAIGASIICNLSDLSIDDRQAFVAAFLGAMMRMPREQWRPCLVLIDEVQLVCPERTEGDPVSAAAVVDLAARGRKRGYGLVVTSQRMAKIRKDLVAECHNRLIGYISLPADMARAASELGFESKQRSALKLLSPGEFYAFGPALSRETILVRNADVLTKEPVSGTSRVAPAPASVQALLEQLGTLPPIPADPETGDDRARIGEDRARMGDARAPIDREIAMTPAVVFTEAELTEAVDNAVRMGANVALREVHADVREEIRALREVLRRWELRIDAQELKRAEDDEATELRVNDWFAGFYCHPAGSPRVAAATAAEPTSEVKAPAPSAEVKQVVATINAKGVAMTLGATQSRMVGVLKQLWNGGLAEATREELAMLSGLTQSGTFRNYLSDLRTAGVIETAGQIVRLTPVGHSVPHYAAPFATVRELHDFWLQKVGGTQSRMLWALMGVYPDSMTREALAKQLNLALSGTFRNYLSDLRKPGLIVTKGDLVTASALLFPKGLPR